MTIIEKLIPDLLLERSLAFKTAVLIVGALLLLFASIIRPDYPVLWAIFFLAGALVEWIIVATVYIEIGMMESEIQSTESDIEAAADEIDTAQREVESTKKDIIEIQREVESTKEDVFSFSSDSQGVGKSLEDRVKELENETGTGRSSAGHGSLERRVSELEEAINHLGRRR